MFSFFETGPNVHIILVPSCVFEKKKASFWYTSIQYNVALFELLKYNTAIFTILQFQALREMVHTNPQILQVIYLV